MPRQTSPLGEFSPSNQTHGAVYAFMASIHRADPGSHTYDLVDNQQAVYRGVVPFGEGEQVYTRGTPVVVFRIPGGGLYFAPVQEGSWGSDAYETAEDQNLLEHGLPYRTLSSVARQRDNPRDMKPGDWAKRGSLGNLVAVLKNGMTLLRGSRAAEIILNGIDGVVQVISRRYVHISPFGKIEIEADPKTGATSLKIRGRANTAYQGRGNYQLAVDLGASGGVLRAEVRDGNGTPVGWFHLRQDGSLDMYSPPGELNQVARTSRKDVAEAYTKVIGGQTTEEYRNTRTVTGTGEKKRLSGVQETDADSVRQSAQKGMSLSAGTLSLSAHPSPMNPATLTPASVAHDVNISNGSLRIGVGNLVDLTARSSYTCEVKGGNITFLAGSALPGAFKGLAMTPSASPVMVVSPTEGTLVDPNANLVPQTGVLLGVPVKPMVPPLKWTPDLLVFLTALASAMDTHVHPVVIPGPPPVPLVSGPPTPAGPPATQGLSTQYTAQTVGAGVLVN